MTGILYFSSTGNSLYIAEKIKSKVGGKIAYIPAYGGNGNEFDSLIIVTPVYSFGMPCPVYDLLLRLDREKEIVIIQNYGGMLGGADYFVYKYAIGLGLKVSSIYAIKMPENFTLTFTMPKLYLKYMLHSANKRIDRVIESIISKRQNLPKRKKTKEKTYFKNKGNWHLIGERFSVTNACTKCGKCISVCPVKNIGIKDNKIVFSTKCIACLGCYHRCPQRAIVYLNKRKKDRYINPNINENLIGKDID